jgi:crotonobetainyl-CoA:carnitine CoA-transferase CaiB-like acyl-CoA transferase
VGPPFDDDLSAYFSGANRNKRSIVVDIAEADGREIILRLLADTDVLVHNFKTGAMEKWGLGYDAVLGGRFPRLIMCHITGFGPDGPLGGFPGYDAVVQAMTGLMSINGDANDGRCG